MGYSGSVLGVLAAFSGTDVPAQNYPVKPVRVVISSSAGSGADVIARIVTSGMTPAIGQQVIVDYRPGAGGNIAAELVAKSPPDGYVLFQSSLSQAANAAIFSKLAYDLVQDFSPVTLLATSPAVIIVHPSLPAKSVAELVRLAKAKPDAITFASAGVGTASFVGAELFKGTAKVELLHVPYRGGGEALTAVISGESPVMFGPIASALPHIRQGRVRAIAVTSAARLAFVPEFPTVAESGYPGYESGNWYGLVAPARTPKEVIATIRSAAIASLKDAAVSRRLADLGYISIGSQPEEFGAFTQSEIEKLAAALRKYRVKPR